MKSIIILTSAVKRIGGLVSNFFLGQAVAVSAIRIKQNPQFLCRPFFFIGKVLPTSAVLFVRIEAAADAAISLTFAFVLGGQ